MVSVPKIGNFSSQKMSFWLRIKFLKFAAFLNLQRIQNHEVLKFKLPDRNNQFVNFSISLVLDHLYSSRYEHFRARK